MRAPLLALLFLACSACTQGNTQLPPFYDAGASSAVDSSASDAAEEAGEDGSVEASPGDAAPEAASDASKGDAAAEDGSLEAGPGDAGDGGG
jgi:hypothetical protein